jgi:ATP-dependent Lon protease
MLAANNVFLALACLLFLGCGRRVQSSVEEWSSSQSTRPHQDAGRSLTRPGILFDPLQTLATVLAAQSPSGSHIRRDSVPLQRRIRGGRREPPTDDEGDIDDEKDDDSEDEGNSQDHGEDDSLERELLQRFSNAVAGLARGLEHHLSNMGNSSNTTSDESKESSPMFRFRVFHAPMGVPGFPQFMQNQGSGNNMGMPQGFPIGGPGDEDNQLQALARRLQAANLPQEAEQVAIRELKRLGRMQPSSQDYASTVEYLEWIADLPWSTSSADRLKLSAAQEQLEADHFGMERVKARILEYLSVCKLTGDTCGSILCLHGPPGIGKTSLGRSIADALNRDFYRISLGGVHTESEVRGHRRTYLASMPGSILDALKKCGTNNCVIMLDEIDKVGRDSANGDPSAALLEVLDPAQNHAFRDHYLNIPFNLSKVLFITTANELGPIPRPLRDRMEIIDMSGYTVEEKIQIARRHLLPKQRKKHGLRESDIQIDESVIDALITGYTLESGVRELERQIAALCRSIAKRIAMAAEDTDAGVDHGKSPDAPSVTVTEGILHKEDLLSVLGPPKFDGPRDNVLRVSKAGVAVGLAYTPVGGDVLYVEAEKMGGKGELMITGKLGDVMEESVRVAIGWVRAHAGDLGIPVGAVGHSGPLLNGTDLHLHFPAGALPKDGPSAGVTIATAIVSLLTGRQVRPDLAMTGEITLRGHVLPVGGIKEKLVAAHRAGMKHILIPVRNEKDLREVPASVLDDVEITFVNDIEDVLDVALTPPIKAAGSGDGGSRKTRGRPYRLPPRTTESAVPVSPGSFF